MDDAFADRFDALSFANDEPVHIFRSDRYGHNDEGVWMPETLWHRLRYIGTAYSLHLLPLLDGTTDPVFLNPQQVAQFLRELHFITLTVDDPLLREQVSALVATSRLPSEGASKDKLGIEFP